MILHKVKILANKVERNGKTIYCYKAICNADIFSLQEFAIGGKVSVGAAPHGQCAKCFASVGKPALKEPRMFEGLSGGMDAPVYDEKGNKVMLSQDNVLGKITDMPGNSNVMRVKRTLVEDPTVQGDLCSDDGIGALEGGDYE